MKLQFKILKNPLILSGRKNPKGLYHFSIICYDKEVVGECKVTIVENKNRIAVINFFLKDRTLGEEFLSEVVKICKESDCDVIETNLWKRDYRRKIVSGFQILIKDL